MLHFIKDNSDCYDYVKSIPVDITISHIREIPKITHFKVDKRYAHSSTYNGRKWDLTLNTQLKVWLQDICGTSKIGKDCIKPILYTLMSNKGKKIAIFYPEMCISDEGQSILAQFLAIAANFNDIILYSYSEHIYYSIRIAIKEGFISHNSVKINYLSNEEGTVNFEEIIVDEDGGLIKGHTDGFFTQHTLNLIRLI